MDITSLKFLFLFLPVFVILYLVARNELRVLLITVANVVFLIWSQRSAILWLSMILATSYLLGLYLSSEKGMGKAVGLWIGIGINLLLLCFFKFYIVYGLSFISGEPPTSLAVPVGISFVTFQAISYLVDVRRGTIPAERKLLRFAVYLFFFPKLVSGPLLRYRSFADQIKEVHLPENFNNPYLARSISNFWRRWHITLTAWFRENVFYPLERQCFRWASQQINITIVFLLTGLWHGFRPASVIWGLIHGLVLATENLGFGRWLNRLWRPLQHIYTLTIILIGWIFFRSNSLSFALAFFRHLAGDTSLILAMVLGVIFIFPIGSLWEREKAEMESVKPAPHLLFQAANAALLIALFVLGLAASVNRQLYPNIYAAF